MYILSFGQEGDRWRVMLKTAVRTYYFATLEEMILFLVQETDHQAITPTPGMQEPSYARPEL